MTGGYTPASPRAKRAEYSTWLRSSNYLGTTGAGYLAAAGCDYLEDKPSDECNCADYLS